MHEAEKYRAWLVKLLFDVQLPPREHIVITRDICLRQHSCRFFDHEEVIIYVNGIQFLLLSSVDVSTSILQYEQKRYRPHMIPSPVDHTGISFSGELRRKALHLIALCLPVGVLILGKPTGIKILVPVTLFVVLIDFVRFRSDWLNDLVRRVFGSMMRDSELSPAAARHALNGATWTLVSMTLLLLLFPLPIAVLAFMMGMIGDAAAAVFGRTFGRRPWGRAGCTIEGSAAYLTTAFLTAIVATGTFSTMWVGGTTLTAVAIASIVGMLAEALPIPGNDNVTAPVMVAVTMYLIAGTMPLAPLLAQLG